MENSKITINVRSCRVISLSSVDRAAAQRERIGERRANRVHRSPIVRASILFGYYNNSDTIASNCASFRWSWVEDDELPVDMSA